MSWEGAFERDLETLDLAIQRLRSQDQTDQGDKLATAVDELRVEFDRLAGGSLTHAAINCTEALKSLSSEACDVQLGAAVTYLNDLRDRLRALKG